MIHLSRSTERLSKNLDISVRSVWLKSLKGRSLTIEKVVALHISRDHAISECGLAAQTDMSRASRFSSLLKTHSQRWERLWQRCDIVLDDSQSLSQLILRLHIFHLLQTVSPNSIDLDIGVPARGLHGEAYRGHIFWDELFIFPLLNLRIPDITRSLLRYRYRAPRTSTL